MDPEVDWPNVLEGTVIHGKEELKAYWQKQWKESDPQVDPVQIKDMGAHTYDVTVHQVVKDLTGKVLVDQQVHHIYSFVGGQVRKMEIRKTE